MTLLLKSTITPEGYAAALNNVPNANGFRIELTKVRAVANGVPKDIAPATGVNVGNQQTRIRATLTSQAEEYSFDELWVYDGISNQVFVKIKRADNGVIDFISPHKRAIINYNITFTTLPDGSVTIVADNGQSPALAELDAHKDDPSAHPEIIEELSRLSIFQYSAVPTIKVGDIIYVNRFGFMVWVEKWKMYRSLEAAKKRNGWSVVTKPGWILGNGATYSKHGNYKGLWTAALDAEIVLRPENWHEGQYIFIDVDDNTFRVPSIGGYFDRNASMGAAVDAGRIIFSGQLDAIRNITGGFYAITAGGTSGVFGRSNSTQKTSTTNTGLWYESTTNFDASRVVPTADDNHPYNTAYPAWIKI